VETCSCSHTPLDVASDWRLSIYLNSLIPAWFCDAVSKKIVFRQYGCAASVLIGYTLALVKDWRQDATRNDPAGFHRRARQDAVYASCPSHGITRQLGYFG
jgi:hypothetical protein